MPCEEILEEPTYLKMVVASLLASLLTVMLLVGVDILNQLRAIEVLELTAAYLLLGYPFLKLVQKVRRPERRVWREMGSIYTNRFDRVLIGLIVISAILIGTGAISPGNLGGQEVFVNPDHASIRAIVVLATAITGTVAAIAIIVDQGWDFFDFSIKNTYIHRARNQRQAQS